MNVKRQGKEKLITPYRYKMENKYVSIYEEYRALIMQGGQKMAVQDFIMRKYGYKSRNSVYLALRNAERLRSK